MGTGGGEGGYLGECGEEGELQGGGSVRGEDSIQEGTLSDKQHPQDEH